jgi:hypothetical protein
MDEKTNFQKRVIDLEKTILKIEGVTTLGKKTFEDKNIISIRYLRNKVPNSFVTKRLEDHYKNEGFYVKFKEGAYWIENSSESYVYSINSLSEKLTFAEIQKIK